MKCQKHYRDLVFMLLGLMLGALANLFWDYSIWLYCLCYVPLSVSLFILFSFKLKNKR